MAATLWLTIYPKFRERFRRGIINICTCSFSEAMHSCAQYGTDCISAVESRRKHREIHSGSSHGSAKIWHLFAHFIIVTINWLSPRFNADFGKIKDTEWLPTDVCQ